jgi:hypothetical protein
MRKYLLYIALSIVAVFLVFDSVFGQSDKPFLGKPLPQMLQPWGTIICFSDTSATTGFYRDLNSAAREVTLESSALKKQKAGGGYRITFQGEQAMVFDEFMNETYEFIVYER